MKSIQQFREFDCGDLAEVDDDMAAFDVVFVGLHLLAASREKILIVMDDGGVGLESATDAAILAMEVLR